MLETVIGRDDWSSVRCREHNSPLHLTFVLPSDFNKESPHKCPASPQESTVVFTLTEPCKNWLVFLEAPFTPGNKSGFFLLWLDVNSTSFTDCITSQVSISRSNCYLLMLIPIQINITSYSLIPFTDFDCWHVLHRPLLHLFLFHAFTRKSISMHRVV